MAPDVDAETDATSPRLRRDLRLHDNPALVAAADADRLLPVYVVDPADYGPADFGGPRPFTYEKTGGRRTRFRLDALDDLRIDRRKGAACFETRPIDDDPASNDGNRAYVAGVGNDSWNRSFDVLWQANRYDAEAACVRRWLPELDGLVPEATHEPWTLPDKERARLNYPAPIVDPAALSSNG
ncbi:MAG: FAD-binding domain-containing protein [Haloplanus sp.]